MRRDKPPKTLETGRRRERDTHHIPTMVPGGIPHPVYMPSPHT